MKLDGVAGATYSVNDTVTSGTTLPANKRLITLQLKFEISQTDADTINTFLDTQFDASQESFNYTLGSKYSGKKFICVRRTETFPVLNRVKMNLTFEEVAEP